MQTVFKYNLEFINNKHYSLRPTNDASDASAAATAAERLLSRRNRIDGNDANNNDDTNDIQTDDERRMLPARRAIQKQQQYRQQFIAGNKENQQQHKPSRPNDAAWWSPNVRSIWRHWSDDASIGAATVTTTTESNVVQPLQPPHGLLQALQPMQRQRLAVDEQIIGRLGETIEICRPCTDFESAHAFCSSEIGE